MSSNNNSSNAITQVQARLPFGEVRKAVLDQIRRHKLAPVGPKRSPLSKAAVSFFVLLQSGDCTKMKDATGVCKGNYFVDLVGLMSRIKAKKPLQDWVGSLNFNDVSGVQAFRQFTDAHVQKFQSLLVNPKEFDTLDLKDAISVTTVMALFDLYSSVCLTVISTDKLVTQSGLLLDFFRKQQATEMNTLQTVNGHAKMVFDDLMKFNLDAIRNQFWKHASKQKIPLDVQEVLMPHVIICLKLLRIFDHVSINFFRSTTIPKDAAEALQNLYCATQQQQPWEPATVQWVIIASEMHYALLTYLQNLCNDSSYTVAQLIALGRRLFQKGHDHVLSYLEPLLVQYSILRVNLGLVSLGLIPSEIETQIVGLEEFENLHGPPPKTKPAAVDKNGHEIHFALYQLTDAQTEVYRPYVEQFFASVPPQMSGAAAAVSQSVSSSSVAQPASLNTKEKAPANSTASSSSTKGDKAVASDQTGNGSGVADSEDLDDPDSENLDAVDTTLVQTNGSNSQRRGVKRVNQSPVADQPAGKKTTKKSAKANNNGQRKNPGRPGKDRRG